MGSGYCFPSDMPLAHLSAYSVKKVINLAEIEVLKITYFIINISEYHSREYKLREITHTAY